MNTHFAIAEQQEWKIDLFPPWTEYMDMLPHLLSIDEFTACRAGKATRQDFARAAEARFGKAIEIDPGRFSFYPRAVPAPRKFVEEALDQLHQQGWIGQTQYQLAQLEPIIEKLKNFDSSRYKSFIHPEELLLTFALTQIIAPTTIVSLGSYFGFWTLVALAGARVTNGNARAVLIDIDPEVCAVARRMAHELGLDPFVEILSEDPLKGIQPLPAAEMYMLDAETPRNHPEPTLRDKAIYGPLTKKIRSCAQDDSILLAHNVLFEDALALPSMHERVAYNAGNMSSFLEETRHARRQMQHQSCEGLGLYQW